MAAKVSIHTEKFLAGMNDKFFAHEIASDLPGKFYVRAGRKYDKVLHESRYGGGSVYVFIDRITGDLIKAGGQAPQRSPITGELAIRYNIATEEGYAQAIKVADEHGAFLYEDFAKNVQALQTV